MSYVMLSAQEESKERTGEDVRLGAHVRDREGRKVLRETMKNEGQAHR